MPETSSRISASSSTMRMSSAMGSSIRCELMDFQLAQRLCFAGACGLRGETQPHPCSPLAGDLVGGISELDASAVLFQDFSDNGEAQTRALLPCGDVGLEQPTAVLLRQPDPIVDHVDDDVGA